MTAMFRSLASKNYRIWFIGALVSNVGAWMQATTQNWVVLTMLTDNDAVAVGVTMALQFGPQLLLVPITGTLADRVDRRTILFCTQTALMLLGAALGLLLLFDAAELWHLYLFALLLGIVNAVDGPARQTFVSDLVREENMANAVALNSASFNAARMIGPAVAGFLIVLIGSGWVFLVNAATFLAVLAALAMIRPAPRGPRPVGKRAGAEFIEGFKYAWGRPDLIVVFVIVFLVGAFAMNFPIVSSTMAVEFGRGAGEYGLLSSILAIGSLTGALLAARRERARFGVIVLAAGGLGVASAVSAFMPSFWSFAASLILIGFSAVTLLTTANGYVQTTTEPAVRGRVMAIYMAILLGGTPVGAPVVGWVANELGPRWGLGVAAVAGLLAFAIAIGWLVIAHRMRLRVRDDSAWRLTITSDQDGLAGLGQPAAADEARTPTTRPLRLPVPTTTTPIAVVTENPHTGALRAQRDRREVRPREGGPGAAAGD